MVGMSQIKGNIWKIYMPLIYKRSLGKLLINQGSAKSLRVDQTSQWLSISKIWLYSGGLMGRKHWMTCGCFRGPVEVGRKLKERTHLRYDIDYLASKRTFNARFWKLYLFVWRDTERNKIKKWHIYLLDWEGSMEQNSYNHKFCLWLLAYFEKKFQGICI
jgi:hypothetical protein